MNLTTTTAQYPDTFIKLSLRFLSRTQCNYYILSEKSKGGDSFTRNQQMPSLQKHTTAHS